MIRGRISDIDHDEYCIFQLPLIDVFYRVVATGIFIEDSALSKTTYEVNKVVNTSLDHFGHIDVLANTVGGYRAGTPIHDTPIDTWDFMMNLNARTLFITTHSVAPHMIAQGRGKIIHLAARPGQRGRADMGAYSASKAAVIRLTESAAAELKGHNINVNCLLPGTLDTPQNRQAMPDADFSRWVSTASLAGVILFLASDVARDIHGAAIPVTGLTA